VGPRTTLDTVTWITSLLCKVYLYIPLVFYEVLEVSAMEGILPSTL